MSDPANDSDDDTSTARITDDQLPEDLQPGEDNPLAEPLGPDEDVEGVSLEDRTD